MARLALIAAYFHGRWGHFVGRLLGRRGSHCGRRGRPEDLEATQLRVFVFAQIHFGLAVGLIHVLGDSFGATGGGLHGGLDRLTGDYAVRFVVTVVGLLAGFEVLRNRIV